MSHWDTLAESITNILNPGLLKSMQDLAADFLNEKKKFCPCVLWGAQY